jgi:hypothetical protein
MKFVPPHAAGVFHCRRQFHTRQRISLVPQERISQQKAPADGRCFLLAGVAGLELSNAGALWWPI